MKIPKIKLRKQGKITSIDGEKINFEIKKQIILKQTNYPKKIFVLQDLQFENGIKEIRIGYYIIGKRGRAKGRWTWGQFCPLFPKKDLIKLIKMAKKEKII